MIHTIICQGCGLYKLDLMTKASISCGPKVCHLDHDDSSLGCTEFRRERRLTREKEFKGLGGGEGACNPLSYFKLQPTFTQVTR